MPPALWHRNTNNVSRAILQYRIDGGSAAAFGLINAGGVRATIEEGNITRGQVLNAFPFGNAVVEVTYTGDELWKIFEGLVSGINQFNDKEVSSFFQVSSGVKVEYNPDNEIGSRLVRLSVGGKPVDNSTNYLIVTADFLTGGGDNILEPVEDVVLLDQLDEVLSSYIEKHSPIDFKLDGRISVVDGRGGTNTEEATETNEGPTPSETPSTATKVVVGSYLAIFTTMLAVIA